MNVISYIRVSGRGQLDGDGPERQREAVRNFCVAKGLHCTDEFFEEAVSGTVEGVNRPKFSRMLDFIDRDLPIKTTQAIVVERMDRLARDLMVSEVLLAEMRKRGIQVFSADQGELIDMAADGADVDPTRVLIRQIMGALSQWEKTNLVRKLRAAKNRKKAQGIHCEGTARYGATPQEKTIKHLMTQLHSAGLSWAVIAVHLNQNGWKTRLGRDWNRETVRFIVKERGLT
jgi:DNA invertase Pin-like site-specific DNA recombinase